MRRLLLAGVVVALVAALALGWVWRGSPARPLALEAGSLAGAYLVADPRMRGMAAYLIVQAGEVDNTGAEGLAHYVEHLSWLNAIGTQPAAYDRHTNAWTNAMATVYWLNAPGDAARILSTLARVFDPVSLPRDFARQERDIVRRERDLRFGDDPLDDVRTELARTLHASDPLGRSVIGSRADIASFTVDEALALKAVTHRPERAVLVLTGDLTRRAAQGLVTQAFGAGPGDVPAAPPLSYTMAPVATDRQEVTLPGTGGAQMLYAKVVALPAPMEPSQLDAISGLLFEVLDSTLPGSLAKPLRFDAQLAQGYDLSLTPLDAQHLMLSFDARPDRGVGLDDLLTTFEATLASIARGGIPEDTFDRIAARRRAMMDHVDDRAQFAMGATLDLLQRRLPPEGFARIAAREAAVTRADLNKLVTALAGPGRVVVRLVRPSPQ